MGDRFARIDRKRGRAEVPTAAAQPLALPGYRFGFDLSLNLATGVASITPGVVAIRGQLVTVPDPTALSESAVRWVSPRVPLSTVFDYLDVSGDS